MREPKVKLFYFSTEIFCRKGINEVTNDTFILCSLNARAFNFDVPEILRVGEYKELIYSLPVSSYTL